MRHHTAMACMLAVTATAWAQPAGESVENPPGWTWASPPRSIEHLSGNAPMSWVSAGVAVTLVRTCDGYLHATLVHSGPLIDLTGEGTVYRIVAVDEAGLRHEFKGSGSSSTSSFTVNRFRLDGSPEDLDALARVGVEALPPEGRRLVARLALEEAAEAGIEVLPYPRIGRAYDFELTDVDGRPVRSADLRGKVVLIDFWATWCGPCMAKMPALKGAYERWHDEGLEVIGVSFDRDTAVAREAFAELGIPWTLVHVPQEDRPRELWDRATGITMLPRLLVVGRDGVLRETLYPHDVQKQIAAYFAPQP